MTALAFSASHCLPALALVANVDGLLICFRGDLPLGLQVVAKDSVSVLYFGLAKLLQIQLKLTLDPHLVILLLRGPPTGQGMDLHRLRLVQADINQLLHVERWYLLSLLECTGLLDGLLLGLFQIL